LGRLFGTDGVRGIANQDLSPELVLGLGRAGARLLSKVGGRVVVGRDTRISGPLLESALIAGICSVGTHAIRLGVLTTPALAHLTKVLEADAGVIISASHNPFEYNGIKFFDREGFKLSDEKEDELEALLGEPASPLPEGERIGTIQEENSALDRYIDHAKGSAGAELTGLQVGVDCANGATFTVAPRILEELGARVLPLCNQPDGLNINAGCGSTHPKKLQEFVKANRLDAGLAFDGDGDRMIAVDEEGNLVDGDFILAICAVALKEQGNLEPPALVTTVMTNLGFDLTMQRAGIEVIKTKVGDRYVLQEMLARGILVGGEQSGHIIFLRHSKTGDGIITALQLLSVMKGKGKRLSHLAKIMTRLPQVLVNVKVRDRGALEGATKVWQTVEAAEKELSDRGRVLVRASGTEPVVRVMVEAEDSEKANRISRDIAAIIEKELGA
jgi:phosphoglucosamine mutase